MTTNKFAEFVVFRRKEMGLTQNELASRLNVTDKAVSKWERGLNYPDISILKNLAEQLEVSVLELLEGEPKMGDKEENKDIDEAVNKTLDFSNELLRNQKRNYISLGIILIIVISISIGAFQVFSQTIGLFGTSMHDVVKQLNELKLQVVKLQSKSDELNIYGNGVYYCNSPDSTFESIEFISPDIIRVYAHAVPAVMKQELNIYFQIKKIGIRQYTITADVPMEDTTGSYNLAQAKQTWIDNGFNLFKVIEVSVDHKTLVYGWDPSYTYCLLNKQP